MKTKMFFLSCFLGVGLIFLALPGFAQEIIGLWKADKVTIGDRVIQPDAKWTNIHEDGSFQTGNGWLQNAEGTWKYDATTQEFLPIENMGIHDTFGPYQVSFQNGRMIWEREEEGSLVRLHWEPIPTLPKSAADLVTGLWTPTSMSRNGNASQIADTQEQRHFLLLRWDRNYIERKPGGENYRGYWHINGRGSELTFLDPNQYRRPEIWRISVSEKELIMSGMSDSNSGVEVHYQRIDSLPE
jgi:hypothetical protein